MVTFIPNFLEKMAGQKRSRKGGIEDEIASKLQVTEDKLKAAKDELKETEDYLKEAYDDLKETEDELKADELKAAGDRLSRDECHHLKEKELLHLSIVDKLLGSINMLLRKVDNLHVNVGDLQTKLNEFNTSKFIVLKCSMHALTLLQLCSVLYS